MKNILILVDNQTSWIIPYAEELNKLLNEKSYNCQLIHTSNKIKPSDVLFLLGCEKIIKSQYLKINKHNIVIHESALPQGRGWSPLTWLVLEGKDLIPFTLFEAGEEVDSGKIYLQDFLKLTGYELNSELKDLQGKKTISMCLDFLVNYNSLIPQEQNGEPSFYPRRTPKDSELDINKSIAEQFNLLRVSDNERYPSFFYFKGKKYKLKIYQED